MKNLPLTGFVTGALCAGACLTSVADDVTFNGLIYKDGTTKMTRSGIGDLGQSDYCSHGGGTR